MIPSNTSYALSGLALLSVFKGIPLLAINFHKICLYSIKFGFPSDHGALKTLNYSSGLLPLTYLRVPMPEDDLSDRNRKN